MTTAHRDRVSASAAAFSVTEALSGTTKHAAFGTRVIEPARLALSVRGLSVRFGAVVALTDVGLDVRPGEVVGLCGENGAGKSTLLACIAGNVAPSGGDVRVFGETVGAGHRDDSVAVVWQDLELCDNLDVAANVLLGRERTFFLGLGGRLHKEAATLIAELRIPLTDTTINVAALSGGQRQLVALARALRDRPRVLLLDEPTASLGVNEGAEVERLILRLREQGVAIVLVSHDIEQLFRISDRIVVLRAGSVVGDVDPERAHFDDVVSLMAGQQLDSSPRGQLTRLHGLVERLAQTDRSSSVALILSTLGTALRVEQLSIHVVERGRLRLIASVGLDPEFLAAWRDLDLGPSGGAVGLAASIGLAVIDDDVRTSSNWLGHVELAARAGISSSRAVPIVGTDGVLGVISVLGPVRGQPDSEELELVSLYAGYVASALERERLFGEVTVRNAVLETIREVLETLAGPVPVADAIAISLQALAEGLGADEVALVCQPDGGTYSCRAAAGSKTAPSTAMLEGGRRLLADRSKDGGVQRLFDEGDGEFVAVSFSAPQGHSALVARFVERPPSVGADDLISDASHSLRLSLEREEVGIAHQEAAALRRSRELQRGFLSRLSHELRTPLTAIRGFASSLMQDDVTWDRDSERRFLGRMASESARLGRLVDDLLDFSAIESGVLRLQPDWLDLPLVVEAAAALLPAHALERVDLVFDEELPVLWADHDRLEQVFVNLMDNAFRHNPKETSVRVEARCDNKHDVAITIADTGAGLPTEVTATLFEPGRRFESPSAGTGLGLSIAKAIIVAHGGTIELVPTERGTTFLIRLPIEAAVAETEEFSDV